MAPATLVRHFSYSSSLPASITHLLLVNIHPGTILGPACGGGLSTCGLVCAGQFYECLNMATLYKLPHIFVVENNKWAIGMQHMRATSPTMGDEDPYIYKKGPPFGMPGIHVDGMDVLKVSVPCPDCRRTTNTCGPPLITASRCA